MWDLKTLRINAGVEQSVTSVGIDQSIEHGRGSDNIKLRRSGRVRTTCYYKGFKYTRAWASWQKIVYRCSKYRTGCRGKMKFRISSMGYTCVHTHTCQNTTVASTLINVKAEMRAQADLLAIEHELRNRFYADDIPDVVQGLTEAQVVRRVHHGRNQNYFRNVHGLVDIPPLSLTLEDAVSFFQFHYTTLNREDLNKPRRNLGWAHPALVALQRCVPTGYAQCVVFMVHDRVSGVFVPAFYILTTLCDFESGLMNALQTQFPNAIILGCLVHMIQALRRAMKRYAIPDEECQIAMTRGVLDTLTVMEHEHVKLRCAVAGLTYSTEKWGRFWDYFVRTWLGQYTIKVWNVFGLNNELIARTNNPLERFNCELNSRFPAPHPSMATFVTVIKALSSEYPTYLEDVHAVFNENELSYQCLSTFLTTLIVT
ncbi:hypothetical protein PHPALM_28116 [Phytophthora palmivora]|uniref:FLYWCH-type domain-containing protein n=1 Tax=Phytophthora palmivora TaxID=4796 RepID=A0A2P4XAY2_9STRA|nr:hypothetical protein PHPALM_28116 [Phytophthora palmivora]